MDRVAYVTLSAGERHVRLAVSLGDEFTGGELILFPPGSTVSVEGADESAAAYTRTTWASGLASGALYAFRTLRAPRRRVVVTELAVRLGANDMGAVATAAALAVAKLVGQELPAVPTDGWTLEKRTLVTERIEVERVDHPPGGSRLSARPDPATA